MNGLHVLVQHTREELAIIEASTAESHKTFQNLFREKRDSDKQLQLCRDEITRFKAAEDAGESKHKRLQLKLQQMLQEAKDYQDEIARSQSEKRSLGLKAKDYQDEIARSRCLLVACHFFLVSICLEANRH